MPWTRTARAWSLSDPTITGAGGLPAGVPPWPRRAAAEAPLLSDYCRVAIRVDHRLDKPLARDSES